MSFESGVKYYTHAHALIEVSFPEDKCVCQWCPFVKNEDSLKRHKCVITGEFLVYPFTGVGQECPLIIEEDI